MNKYIFLVILLVALSCKTKEHTRLEPGEQAIVDHFFTELQAGNSSKALNDLLRRNPQIDPADSLTIALKMGFERINNPLSSGAFVDYKMINNRNILNEVTTVNYLVRYEKSFTSFRSHFTITGKGSTYIDFRTITPCWKN